MKSIHVNFHKEILKNYGLYGRKCQAFGFFVTLFRLDHLPLSVIHSTHTFVPLNHKSLIQIKKIK